MRCFSSVVMTCKKTWKMPYSRWTAPQKTMWSSRYFLYVFVCVHECVCVVVPVLGDYMLKCMLVFIVLFCSWRLSACVISWHERPLVPEWKELHSCALIVFRIGCPRIPLSFLPQRQSASTFTSSMDFSQTLTAFWEKTIEVVKETKFLGLIFDTKLTLKNHLQPLKSSCSCTTYWWQNMSHPDITEADCIILLCLCLALDCSKFNYRCIVYGSAHWSVLNQGLHIVLGAFCTSPAQSLYVEVHKLSLAFFFV